MSRRQRVDSATAAVGVMSAAARTLDPPAGVKLDPKHLPFWKVVLKGRPKSEWNEADLVTAAQLAKVLFALEESDPAEVAEFDKLARLSLAMRRSLGLDVRGKDGRASDVARRREHTAGIESGYNPMAEDDDGLLAQPSLQ